MRLTIYSTEELLEIDGVPVRKWMGRTDNGGDCLVFVHRIAVEESNVLLASQCDAQLLEQDAPRVVELEKVNP